MKVIYENKVKALGECVNEFKDANMFVLFGDNAPDEITDYCYHVDVTPLNGKIAAGHPGPGRRVLQNYCRGR